VPLYRAFETAVREGLVRSAATPSKGGLAVALVRSALAGGLGVEIDLARAPGADGLRDDVVLFSESNGRFLVTVAAGDVERFERLFGSIACGRLGTVGGGRVVARRGAEGVLDVALAELRRRFKEGLPGG
jgi:phosphoribosylformylglycinamidine synthase